MKIKALITGGTGFIGSHLAEELLSRGYSVIVIDDLSTGSIENIEHLKNNDHFSYVIDSIFNKPLMAELVDKSDVIFHMAAAVGVKLIVEAPVRTITTNVKGTELVLELAAKKKKKVILASTSEVYGKSNADLFQEEDDIILGPTYKTRWCYATSKMIDEFLGLAYWKEQKVPVVIARLFNTVGPKQTGQYGMVIPRFVQQALSNEPITVYGDGTQRRSFTWIGDAVNAMIALSENSDAVGKVINIGHNKDISIYELAVMIKEMTGSKSEIVFIPFEQAYSKDFDDIDIRNPDLSKIQNLIGYRPTKDLRDILKAVIECFRRDL